MACFNVPKIMSAHTTGQIQVIFGPMFSGKTTELMRRMRRYQIATFKCLVIKYAKDTRYDENCIASHDKVLLDAISTLKLEDVREEAEKADVIGIDEGQFFPDLIAFCEAMADAGKTVIVAALDGTFQREGFGDVLKLVPLAERVEKLTAVCLVCNGEGSFTKRIGSETEVEIIGGTDKYLAVCRACYKPKRATLALCSPAKRSATKQACFEGQDSANVAEKSKVKRRVDLDQKPASVLTPVKVNTAAQNGETAEVISKQKRARKRKAAKENRDEVGNEETERSSPRSSKKGKKNKVASRVPAAAKTSRPKKGKPIKRR